MTATSANTHLDRVTRSMLWSAWADALGFMTERVSASFLRKRIGGERAMSTVEWTRRVGGRFGVNMVLPAGSYSDDTQLRLATSRAISTRGFDAEAFAKIELVVWPSYALGAGRASKTAAANLAKSSVPWFGNFYDGYLTAGGNGAAMRIQPHVWSSVDPSSDPAYIVDVIRNAVVTHGHPRAIVGAVLHAVALGQVVSTGSPLEQAEWKAIVERTLAASSLIGRDENLATVWLPLWEKASETRFDNAWTEAVDECAAMLKAIGTDTTKLARTSDLAHYNGIINTLALRNPENVGSGTATTCAALAIATACASDPEAAGLLAANALDTDTDTIGTMVGALVGASAELEPNQPVQDREYLRDEAARLSAVASGRTAKSFNYADLLTWVSPKTQLDCVGLVSGGLALAGIAHLHPQAGRPQGVSKATVWEWADSDYGQTLLIKRRNSPGYLADSQHPALERYVEMRTEVADKPVTMARPVESDQPTLVDAQVDRPASAESVPDRLSGGVNVDAIMRWLRWQNASDAAIGLAARRVAESGSVEQTIAFGVALRELVRQRDR